MPEHILSHQALRIQFHSVQNDFLKLLVTCSVNKMTAMHIFRLIIHNPCGEFLPVFKHAKDYVLCSPVEEHLSRTGRLTSCTSAKYYAVELCFLSCPSAGRTYTYTLAAANAAARVLFYLANGRVSRQYPGCTMLTGPYTGTAGNTALRMVGHTCNTDDTKIAHMGLITVIGTACNIYFYMIMAGEDDRFNLAGQLKCITVAANAVIVSDTCSNVSGSDGWITLFWVPRVRLMGNGIHIHIAELSVHFLYISFQIIIYCRYVLIGNSGNIKSLSGAEMEVSVSPGFSDMLHIAEILGINGASGHSHLQHKFSGNF